MPSGRRVYAAGLAIAALVAAACGSTVPTAQQEVAVTTGDQFGGLSTETVPPGARVNEKGQIVNAQGEVIGALEDVGAPGASGGITTGTATTTGGTTSGSQVASAAPGVTATTITLGLQIVEGRDEVLRAAGVSGVTAFDYRRAWEAIVDDTNQRGGIAGRKVRPVYHEVDETSNDFVREYQEACADWTQDHHVFAALAGPAEQFAGENFFACMEQAGAAVVSGNTVGMTFDERVFPRYPHYVAPFAMDLNTQASALVNGLAKQNYFDKGAKLGLIIFDQPSWDYATKQSFIPALRRHGLELTDIARLHKANGFSEYSQTANEAANAAVRFKAEGITHVMILDVGAIAAFLFMPAAERQAYRPRYGLTSQSGGSALAGLLGEDGKNQLHRARMIGWSPGVDVRAEDNRFSKESEAYQRCLKLMRRNGVEVSGAEATAVHLCEQMRVTKAIIEAGGSTITGDSYIAGIDRLGSSFVPAHTFVTRVSEQIRDGAGAVAPASYFEECRCFRYTGRPYSIPS